MSKFHILLAYILIQFQVGQSQSICEDLAHFCQANGMKYLSITTGVNNNDDFACYQALQKGWIRSRTLTASSKLEFGLDTWLLLLNLKDFSGSKDEIFADYLSKIGRHRIRKSILLFTQPLGQAEVLELKEKLQNLLVTDAHFYLLYRTNDHVALNKTTYAQVFSLKDSTKTLFQELTLNSLLLGPE